MENIKEVIELELQRIAPEKRPTALIALRKEEYECFAMTQSAAQHNQHSYAGLPVVRINSLIEPVVIYTEARSHCTDYLAMD